MQHYCYEIRDVERLFDAGQGYRVWELIYARLRIAPNSVIETIEEYQCLYELFGNLAAEQN